MKVTFKNRLQIVQNYEGTQRIQFDHGVRCDLKMFIEKRKPAKPGEAAHDLDWRVVLEGGSEAEISEYRKEISNSFTTYIKRRTKKDPARVLYKTLESLAGIRSI